MHENKIVQMKEAAEQRNWASFQQALKSLVCAIKDETLLKLLLSYVQVFMNDFWRIYSQHKLEFDELQTSDFDQITSKYLASITDILEQHKGEPGVNNCLKAISKLQSLFQLNRCDEIFIETFLNSTTNLLIAISDQTWGREHPHLYNRWLHGTSNEDLSILATHYASNPKQIQKTKLLLHQFAGDIAVLIQSDRQ